MNSPTAVVIDDSSTSRRSLRAMLTQLGFNVVAEGERVDQPCRSSSNIVRRS